MRFDDRLLTVLNQPSGDRHDAAVRWRQLVDLVARSGSSSDSPTVAQALATVRAEAATVDQPLRAAAARAIAALPLPLGLLEVFVADRLSVSAPVLAAASLETEQWRSLLAVADGETRNFIETLHPELSAAGAPAFTESLVEERVAESGPVPETAPPTPSLSDVVARIERRRRNRAQPASISTGADATPALFRWECGPSGDIQWVDGAQRGALIGRSIARGQDPMGEGVSADIVRAFAVRAPFRDAQLRIGGEGAVAGDWKISGVPTFEPGDGRFVGFRGIALRDAPARAAAGGEARDLLADPNALRELVHEIKTPLNAIIGFAEIIDGQFLGPADRRYRERAADIVAQAGLLLMAIDDLDFAAKVHAAAESTPPRVKLGELLAEIAPSMRDRAEARGVAFDPSRSSRELTAAIDRALAERLIERFCAALIDRASEGERLRLTLDEVGDQCRISINRPAALGGMSDEDLFGEGHGDNSHAAFSLRLARRLAHIAGADLVSQWGALALLFRRA